MDCASKIPSTQVLKIRTLQTKVYHPLNTPKSRPIYLFIRGDAQNGGVAQTCLADLSQLGAFLGCGVNRFWLPVAAERHGTPRKHHTSKLWRFLGVWLHVTGTARCFEETSRLSIVPGKKNVDQMHEKRIGKKPCHP